MKDQISISPGNKKLGSIPSISLPPIKTCAKNLPCYKSCYAKHMCAYRKVIKDAYARNFRILKRDANEYWYQLDCYLEKEHPKYFRFHVSGDIPYFGYLLEVVSTARLFPSTRFEIFTKRYSYLRKLILPIPSNLSVVVSMWKGIPIPKDLRGRYSFSWMYDPKDPDPRIPKVAIACVGNCYECGNKCWKLHELGMDVVIQKH